MVKDFSVTRHNMNIKKVQNKATLNTSQSAAHRRNRDSVTFTLHDGNVYSKSNIKCVLSHLVKLGLSSIRTGSVYVGRTELCT